VSDFFLVYVCCDIYRYKYVPVHIIVTQAFAR